jgi:hypothetical protein
MNKFLLVPFLTALSSVPLFAGAGTGPWALGAYYPGQLDGKYQASVSGNNITGVVGFAIINGGLPFASRSSAAGGGGGGAGGNVIVAGGDAGATAVNTDLGGVDETQNYFAIFVEGRTYTGRTVGMIDINRKKVTGTLIGLQPSYAYRDLSFSQSAVVGIEVVTGTTTVPVLDNLPLLNRGLSGGFTANLKNTKNLMTFKGTGELATPAQTQTITANPPTFTVPPLVPGGDPIVINGFTPSATSATIETHTVSFNVYGIKTSILATDPLASSGAAATGAN